MVQWLGLCTVTTKGQGSIPGQVRVRVRVRVRVQGTKIPQAEFIHVVASITNSFLLVAE